MKGSYPGFVPEGWQVTPWTHDWYKLDPYFENVKGKKDFTGRELSNFGQLSRLRRYGGDMQGVLDKIDYLDSLGITAVYFNPIYDAPSDHKYDTRNWRQSTEILVQILVKMLKLSPNKILPTPALGK